MSPDIVVMPYCSLKNAKQVSTDSGLTVEQAEKTIPVTNSGGVPLVYRGPPFWNMLSINCKPSCPLNPVSKSNLWITN